MYRWAWSPGRRGVSRRAKPEVPSIAGATPHFDVQIKAIKPRRVVTVARFGTLEQARDCAAGMRALGFQAIVHYKDESAPVR